MYCSKQAAPTITRTHTHICSSARTTCLAPSTLHQLSHTHTHIHIHTQAHTHKHKHTHTRHLQRREDNEPSSKHAAPTLSGAHTHIHTYTHIHTHAHTTYTHTHIRTQTHSHTRHLQRREDNVSRLKRVVLIGDHHQLPPVVQNMAIQKYSHLDQPLFTRFIRLGTPYVELNAQVCLFVIVCL